MENEIFIGYKRVRKHAAAARLGGVGRVAAVFVLYGEGHILFIDDRTEQSMRVNARYKRRIRGNVIVVIFNAERLVVKTFQLVLYLRIKVEFFARAVLPVAAHHTETVEYRLRQSDYTYKRRNMRRG